MTREVVPIRHPPPRLRGQGVGGEGLATGDAAQLFVERGLVPVGKEQPARAALDRLAEAAELLDWFRSLWHGRRLAATVACVTMLSAATVWLVDAVLQE